MSPGDLVVCVNNGVIPGMKNAGLNLIKKGDVYTVDMVDKDPLFQDGHFGITLIEVPLPFNELWHSSRFRPCRKTDIGALVECMKERQCEEVE